MTEACVDNYYIFIVSDEILFYVPYFSNLCRPTSYTIKGSIHVNCY